MAAPDALPADPAPLPAVRARMLEHLAALQAHVLAADGFAPAACAFVTELAERLGCDRVSLGVRQRDTVELVAVSHGQPGANVANDRELAAAMEETLANGVTVCVPESDAPPRIAAAHSGLVRRFGGSACSVALMHRSEAVGVVCFERRGHDRFERDEIEHLEHLLCLVGPVLHLRWLDEQPLGARMAAAARAGLALGKRGDGRIKRLGFAAALFLLALAALIPVPSHIGGRARIEGSVQRALVAPLDGYLQAVHVRPGDRVTAGQLLMELADRDLRLEQRKLAGQLDQHENGYAHAIARGDRAQAVVHMARAAEAKAQLELVDNRLQRVQIVAPFDAMVVAGDLSQSVGAPVEIGAPLITVASEERFRVIVQVDERDIAAIAPHREGSLSLSALPWEALPIRVLRVSPIALVAEGENVFEVEAELLGSSGELRPGLQGVAKIDAGKRPLLASGSRRVLDWARLTLWSWTGWP
jgi:multidrug efflux pump subunit AcrA (membrane-fusion protein)